MPKFDVEITRILELATTITVTAKTEEEAEEKAAQLASDATLTWDIQGKYEWQEQADDVRVDNVERA